jgi:hypothetical protein
VDKDKDGNPLPPKEVYEKVLCEKHRVVKALADWQGKNRALRVRQDIEKAMLVQKRGGMTEEEWEEREAFGGTDIQDSCYCTECATHYGRACGRPVVGVPGWKPIDQSGAERKRKKLPLCGLCKRERARRKARERKQRQRLKERPIGVLWIPEMGTLEMVQVSS